MSGEVIDEHREPIWVHCTSCGHEWILFYSPLPVSAMAQFMKSACPVCFEKKKIQMGVKPKAAIPPDGSKTANERIMEWLASGDTGISSESLAFEFLGTERKGHFGIGYPHDPADLGRCLRLIARVPEV